MSLVVGRRHVFMRGGGRTWYDWVSDADLTVQRGRAFLPCLRGHKSVIKRETQSFRTSNTQKSRPQIFSFFFQHLQKTLARRAKDDEPVNIGT